MKFLNSKLFIILLVSFIVVAASMTYYCISSSDEDVTQKNDTMSSMNDTGNKEVSYYKRDSFVSSRLKSNSVDVVKLHHHGNDMTASQADSIIRRNVKRRSYDEWVKVSKCDSSKSVIFAKDILKDSKFTQEIAANPQLVSSYYRNIGADKFRNKIDILRYFSNGSNFFSNGDAQFLYNKYNGEFKRFCINNNGNKIHLEKRGVAYVFVYDETDECLGTIDFCNEGKINYKIKVKCGVNKTNRLLNMPSLPNTKYIIDRTAQGCETEIVTMRDGRKSYVRAVIGGTKWEKNKTDRDEKIIVGYRELMKRINCQTGDFLPDVKIEDDGGHVIPRSWGGQDEALNLFPQNWVMNTDPKYIWKKSEELGEESLKKGDRVEIEFFFYMMKEVKLCVLHVWFVYRKMRRRLYVMIRFII